MYAFNITESSLWVFLTHPALGALVMAVMTAMTIPYILAVWQLTSPDNRELLHFGIETRVKEEYEENLKCLRDTLPKGIRDGIPSLTEITLMKSAKSWTYIKVPDLFQVDRFWATATGGISFLFFYWSGMGLNRILYSNDNMAWLPLVIFLIMAVFLYLLKQKVKEMENSFRVRWRKAASEL